MSKAMVAAVVVLLGFLCLGAPADSARGVVYVAKHFPGDGAPQVLVRCPTGTQPTSGGARLFDGHWISQSYPAFNRDHVPVGWRIVLDAPEVDPRDVAYAVCLG